MFKKILGIIGCFFTFVGGSMATTGVYADAMGTEAGAIDLGEKISSGTVPDTMVEPFTKISELLATLDLRQKAEVTKNVFLSMRIASDVLEFQTNCSKALTMLAASINATTHAGAQYNLPYLLYLTQVTPNEEAISPTAKSEVIEEIINKLSAAKNGDKAHADPLLAKFYELLALSPVFKMYAPS